MWTLYRLSWQDNGEAWQAHDTMLSTSTQVNVVEGGRGRNGEIRDPSPVPVTHRRPNNDDGLGPSVEDSVLDMEIGSLTRKRKLAEMQAAEEISRIEEAEELQQIQFETRLHELQQKKLQRQKSLAFKRMELAQLESETHQSSSHRSPQLPHVSPERLERLSRTTRDVELLHRTTASQSTHNNSNNQSDNNNLTNNVSTGGEINKVVEALTQVVSQSKGNSEEMKKFAARQSYSRELSSFYGDPEDWPAFISEFRGSSKESQFSNVENMVRLKKSLKGPARDAVKSMLVVPENVSQVIETLERNFGQSDQIVSSLVDKVKNLPRSSTEKPKSFMDLSNATTNLVSTMKLLEQTGHMLNPQLLRDLEDKLPTHTRHIWAQHRLTITEQVTLDHFSTWLQQFAFAVNRVGTVRASSSSRELSRHSQHYNQNHRHLDTVMSIVSQDSSARMMECPLCQSSSHTLDKCPEFLQKSVKERWDWARSNFICFCCLRKGHQVKNCHRRKGRDAAKSVCGENGCRLPHHGALHRFSSRPESKPETVAHINDSTGSSSQVILKVIPVKLRGPLGEISTHAFLDYGSTATLLDKQIAEELRLTGPTKQLKLRWTNKNHIQSLKAKIVSLKIIGSNGQVHALDDVKAIPHLNIPSQSVNVQAIQEKFQFLRQVTPAEIEQGQPKILIGQAHWDLIQTIQFVGGPRNGPALSKTVLGWVLHGIVQTTSQPTSSLPVFHCHTEEADEELNQLVKTNFSTENFGVRVIHQLPRSRADIRAKQIMDSTAQRIPERWKIGMLWKEDSPRLPESKSMAMRRLFLIEKKLDKDQALNLLYSSKIQEMVGKGYARKLPTDEAAIEPPNTWYLPHFSVTNPNKPGKLRVVFDAAAKSLNDFLLKGPDQLRPLPSILFNFRLRKIAFGGDIREMFSQVKIQQEDQCAQRFLWRGSGRINPPDVYQFESMIFGAADSPCKSQEIKNKNALEFQKEFPLAVEAIISNTFMDDYYDSTDTIEEAADMVSNVTSIHKSGGFHMCNWVSNSKTVLSSMPSILRANQDESWEISDLPTERVLGIRWDPNLDCFTFQVKFALVPDEIVKGQRRPTKREILRLVMSIFDPIGFIAHFIVRAKILLQDIWRAGLGWDDEITQVSFEKWTIWLGELEKISDIRIPRCYSLLIPRATSIQLHIFCDSSEKAFAAVAYLRVEDEKEVQTSMVMAKTRVSPLKPLSIPRLELQAAVMGSRLSTTILAEHKIPIQSVHFWSDSTSVLRWLRSDARKYNAFVAHRVGEIMESTDISSWKWVPTMENVADEATRDGQDTDISSNSRWYYGPKFLKLSPESWPKEVQALEEEQDAELKPKFLGLALPSGNESLPDPVRFSSWTKLIRTTAWIMRVFRRKKCPNTKFSKILSIEEIEEAEKMWWRQMQADDFPTEVAQLTKKSGLASSSRLLQLSPYLDEEGVIRIKGRTVNSHELSHSTKHPVILAPENEVTKLLILHYHHMMKHQGQSQVVNEIRQKYWILSIRLAVRSCWNSCLVCKLKRATPIPPEMAPLPNDRVTRPLRPFSSTGVDFFGPFDVTVRKRREKRYGVIFTCMSTRAVHLEVAHSLTTGSALMAIQRFIELRVPAKIYSDNGRNLRGAEKEVRQALKLIDFDEINNKLVAKGVEWVFSPPGAPHFGGSWESLIKSVKVAILSILKHQAPNEEVFQTVMAEAQGVVNSHPLTHVSTDHADQESLTPNHFLIGASSRRVPRVHVDADLCLNRQWKVAQRLADNFWRRWVKEYLPTLTRRTKWHRVTRPAQIGDLVLIADDNLKRNLWPRGKISQVYPGKDGIIRVVDVRTSTGEYRRPMTKICILDIAQG